MTEKMSKLKTALLSIPPTSVESERAFSAAGLFMTKLRCRMLPQTLNMFCFLRSYFLRMKKQVQKSGCLYFTLFDMVIIQLKSQSIGLLFSTSKIPGLRPGKSRHPMESCTSSHLYFSMQWLNFITVCTFPEKFEDFRFSLQGLKMGPH